MKNISEYTSLDWNTGRGYSEHGQRIESVFKFIELDEESGDIVVDIYWNDIDRHITKKTRSFIERDATEQDLKDTLMAAYDAVGQSQDIFTSQWLEVKSAAAKS